MNEMYSDWSNNFENLAIERVKNLCELSELPEAFITVMPCKLKDVHILVSGEMCIQLSTCIHQQCKH
jgi:hypothetical protein